MPTFFLAREKTSEKRFHRILNNEHILQVGKFVLLALDSMLVAEWKQEFGR